MTSRSLVTDKTVSEKHATFIFRAEKVRIQTVTSKIRQDSYQTTSITTHNGFLVRIHDSIAVLIKPKKKKKRRALPLTVTNTQFLYVTVRSFMRFHVMFSERPVRWFFCNISTQQDILLTHTILNWRSGDIITHCWLETILHYTTLKTHQLNYTSLLP